MARPGEINFNQPSFNPFARPVKEIPTHTTPSNAVDPRQTPNYGQGPVPLPDPQLPDAGISGIDLAMGGINAGLDGLGQYMSNQASAKQVANQQNQSLQGQLAQLVERQGTNMQDATAGVLNASPAGHEIDPYANMALRRALAGAYSPRTVAMGSSQPTGGLDVSKLQGVMDQFYSDDAIKASMQHQQALRNAVDPHTPQAQAGLRIYGEDYEPYYNAAEGAATASRSRIDASNNASQQALRDAIAQNTKNSKGSFLGGLASVLLKAAPYAAAPFTGGASLMATPITNRL